MKLTKRDYVIGGLCWVIFYLFKNVDNYSFIVSFILAICCYPLFSLLDKLLDIIVEKEND